MAWPLQSPDEAASGSGDALQEQRPQQFMSYFDEQPQQISEQTLGGDPEQQMLAETEPQEAAAQESSFIYSIGDPAEPAELEDDGQFCGQTLDSQISGE